MENLKDIKLYTLTEVAQIIGVTHRTAWSYVKAGKIKGRMIGGKWKISEENLRNFIQGEDAAK